MEKNQSTVVEMTIPGKPSRVVRGIVAEIVLYLVDYADFLSDPRNWGVLEFHFNRQPQDMQAKANLHLEPEAKRAQNLRYGFSKSAVYYSYNTNRHAPDKA